MEAKPRTRASPLPLLFRLVEVALRPSRTASTTTLPVSAAPVTVPEHRPGIGNAERLRFSESGPRAEGLCLFWARAVAPAAEAAACLCCRGCRGRRLPLQPDRKASWDQHRQKPRKAFGNFLALALLRGRLGCAAHGQEPEARARLPCRWGLECKALMSGAQRNSLLFRGRREPESTFSSRFEQVWNWGLRPLQRQGLPSGEVL